MLGASMKKSVTFTLRLTPDLRARLAAAALESDRSERWLVCKFIEAGLARRQRPRRRKK